MEKKTFHERLLCYLTRILKATSDSMRVLRPAQANAFSPAHLNSKKKLIAKFWQQHTAAFIFDLTVSPTPP